MSAVPPDLPPEAEVLLGRAAAARSGLDGLDPAACLEALRGLGLERAALESWRDAMAAVEARCAVSGARREVLDALLGAEAGAAP